MLLHLVAVLSVAVQTPSSRSINVGDATIHYDVTGDSTPVVFIHGWAQDLQIWNQQAAAFSSRFRVIRYDRRGFGKSTGHADASADPDDLRILLDSLGIQSAFLVGLSAGSRTAINFAVAFPERVDALVLYGTAPIPGFTPVPQGPGPVAIVRDIAQRHGLDSAGKFLRAHPLAWMPPDRPQLQDELRRQWASYSGRDLIEPKPESGRVPHATLAQAASLRVPVLVLSGDHDLPLFLQVSDTLSQRIPGAQRVLIANAGHGAHFAQPRQFNDIVWRFLDDVARRTTRNHSSR